MDIRYGNTTGMINQNTPRIHIKVDIDYLGEDGSIYGAVVEKEFGSLDELFEYIGGMERLLEIVYEGIGNIKDLEIISDED